MIKYPTKVTLAKYGLSLEEWVEILHSQNDVCAICLKQPTSGRFYVDHFHAKGWKKMPPEERKKYTRGLLCYIDNLKILTKGVSIQRLRSAADYLERFELRFIGDQKSEIDQS